MNITFWVLLVLMLLMAIAIVIWPLLKRSETDAIAYKESNLNLYEDKLKELEADLAEGRIEQNFYNSAREELDRELLADIPEDSRDNASLQYSKQARRKPWLALFVVIFLPVASLVIYMQLGMHARSGAAPHQSAQQETPPSVEEMAAILEDRIKTQGGDAAAWAMLGRAYKHLGRYDEAISAFGTALEKEKTTQLMLELAEAMALANGKRFDKASHELVMQVLGREPVNANALWFAGVAEYQFGNYWQSVDHFALLAEMAGSQQQISQSIKFYLNDIRSKLIVSGEDVQPIDEALQFVSSDGAKMQQTENAAVSRITVKVDVAKSIKNTHAGDAAIFIYAKAQRGPKMPLAVRRLSLADLPASVGLDDSMAMVEGMNLSSFENVVVSARLSQNGTAVTQSGDYIGSVVVDGVSQSPTVKVTIDTRVP